MEYMSLFLKISGQNKILVTYVVIWNRFQFPDKKNNDQKRQAKVKCFHLVSNQSTKRRYRIIRRPASNRAF